MVGCLGCGMFHDYRPVDVLVRDAETKQPIPYARVTMEYQDFVNPFAPYCSEDVTKEDGTARMWVAAYHVPLEIIVRAEGYLSEWQRLPCRDIPGLAPDAANRSATPFVLEIFAGPPPTLEFVVPDGYRGIVLARYSKDDETEKLAGKRHFTYFVPHTGIVSVKHRRLVDRPHTAVKVDAHYADGKPLPVFPEDSTVGFRFFSVAQNGQVYVVGTKADHEAWTRRLSKKNEEGEQRLDRDLIAKLFAQH